MFKAFVLMDKGLPIKSNEWLIYNSSDELKYYWLSRCICKREEKISQTHYRSYGVAWEEYIRFDDTGEVCLGLFEKKNEQMVLKYVVNGRLKTGKVPKFPF